MILLYPLFVVLSLLMTLLTMLLAPLLALTAGKDGNLPRFLYWFQTFDNSLDAGWKVQGNWGTYLQDGTVPTGFTLYWYRVRWLWRNPAYGFDYWPFGVYVSTTYWRVRATKNWFLAFDPVSFAFHVKYLGPGPQLKLGWKVSAYWDDRATPQRWRENYTWGPSHRAPLCFTIRPW